MKAQHSQSPILELTAIIGTICAFSFIAGFIYPVIALALEARGHDETAIGLNATASGLGILVAGYFIPRLVGRFGTFRVLAFGVALCVVSLMLMPVFSGYWEWVALRIVLAMSVAALFSVGRPGSTPSPTRKPAAAPSRFTSPPWPCPSPSGPVR
jgi:MFS family permease